MNALVGVTVAVGVMAIRALLTAARRSGVRRAEVVHPAGRRRFLRRAARSTRTDLERRLPALAEGVARELRAGASLTTAVFAAGHLAGGPIATDLDEVAQRVAGGHDLAHSLERWARERSSPELDRFVAVVSIGLELGGELAPAFELTADSLRDRRALHDEIGSLTSQSRASGVLLTGLPPVAALGLALLNPATGRFLVASVAGVLCVVVACVLDLVAWVWMRALAGSVR